MKLTKAQIHALEKVAKRDWPAGEPRENWFGKSTRAVLLRMKLVEVRQGSECALFGRGSSILDLTHLGRAALKDKEV